MTIAAIGDTVRYKRSASADADTIANVVVPVNADGSDPALGYPSGSTVLIAGSGNVANASAAATLTGTATTTVYITGFEVTGAGATGASVVAVTVAGLLGGSRIYNLVIPAGAAVSIQPLFVTYFPPLPASAINTALSVTVAAAGAGNTNMAVVAHGFYR